MTVDIIDHSRIIMHTEEQTSLGFPNIVFRKRELRNKLILMKLTYDKGNKNI